MSWLKKSGVFLIVVSLLFIVGCYDRENKYLEYVVVADFPEEIDGDSFLDNIEADSSLFILGSSFQEVENPESGEKRNQYTIVLFNKGDSKIVLDEVTGFYCVDSDCSYEESLDILGEGDLETKEVKIILLATKMIPKRINFNYDLENEEISMDNMNVWYYSDVEF